MKSPLLIFLLAAAPWFCTGLRAQADTTCVKPSQSEIGRSADVLWYGTSCTDPSPARLEAMDVIQRAADHCENTEFYACRDEHNDRKAARMRRGSVMWFYQEAFDKVLREVKTTHVREGETAIWLIYNMGYVVKTPTACFGIDVYHRSATELVPYLDFALVTHKHGDHYTAGFLEAMRAAGKPVVSNFFEAGTMVSEPGAELRFGDVFVTTCIADHNDKLTNFVVTYEIHCGKSGGDCVILHTGDACRADQIATTRCPDLLIPHAKVGLDIQRVADESGAGTVLMSHLLEMGHPRNKWRWSLRFGLEKCAGLRGTAAYVPVWGEKIIWSPTR